MRGEKLRERGIEERIESEKNTRSWCREIPRGKKFNLKFSFAISSWISDLSWLFCCYDVGNAQVN